MPFYHRTEVTEARLADSAGSARLSVRGLRFICGLVLAGVAVGVVTTAGSGFASAPAERAALVKPDLVAVLPTATDAGQGTPVYVDAYSLPGHLLYRFDAALVNHGGALDIFRESTGRIMQVIWPGGVPSSPPDPNSRPTDPNAVIEDRTSYGATMQYVSHSGHHHFHLMRAAQYELLVPGEPNHLANKIGFCFIDTYNTEAHTLYFPYGYYGTGPGTWCRFDEPCPASRKWQGFGLG